MINCQTGQVIPLSCGHQHTVRYNDAHVPTARYFCNRCDGLRPVGPDLATLAVAMTAALDTADVTALDEPAVSALQALSGRLNYKQREALDGRRRALWRESAIVTPDASQFSRLVITDDDANPDALGSMALVQRTDTGLFYLVSTNDEETLTVLTDAAGTWPEESTDATVNAATGRGLTRAEALAILDKTDRIVTQAEWLADLYDDEDDEPEDEH